MSTFAIIGVILSVFAGLLNFFTGLMRRQQMMLMLMRFGLSIFSFIVTAVIIVAKIDGVALLKYLPADSSKYLYLFIVLALYVGLTLMLPATIERNNPAVAADSAPKPNPTGKLAGSPGVRVANQNEEWVN